ncbi:hypothetical protein GCM10010976_25210 [Bizionia arctica]|uniref:Sulfotransferase domain-containing protein n=2 Tax=Bizionia arctica TaxID=1495645 RepID=A0A917GP12_9FLAO|nr:hypothetical protein GCM10010976_25210 [Bizionia arctica]
MTSQNILSLKNEGNFIIPDCINNQRFLKHQNYLNNLKTKLEVEIAVWCINNVNILNHKNNNKWMVVFYEDLVLDPEKTFKAVLKGLNINLLSELLKKIEFRKASASNFDNQLKSKPQEQLESVFKNFNNDELLNIQAIFDYFELKVYSAFNSYPIK